MGQRRVRISNGRWVKVITVPKEPGPKIKWEASWGHDPTVPRAKTPYEEECDRIFEEYKAKHGIVDPKIEPEPDPDLDPILLTDPTLHKEFMEDGKDCDFARLYKLLEIYPDYRERRAWMRRLHKIQEYPLHKRPSGYTDFLDIRPDDKDVEG